ncbi:MAG: glycoside hydrolase family 5 protein, partial [Proteobacteria bacterium]
MKFKNVSILTAFLTVSAACSTTPVVENFPVGANPTDEVQKLDADISAAAANQVDVLAPKNFEEARDSLKDAR